MKFKLNDSVVISNCFHDHLIGVRGTIVGFHEREYIEIDDGTYQPFAETHKMLFTPTYIVLLDCPIPDGQLFAGEKALVMSEDLLTEYLIQE